VLVDTHVHVACADAARFPRRPTGVGSDWWGDASGRADAVLGEVRRAGVDGVVVVQAVGAYGHDPACASDAVAAAGAWARLVPSIDLTSSDPAARLVEVARLPSTVGVRLFGVADGAPWLDDGRADEVWCAAAERGVVLVPTIFSDRLDALHAVIERHPDVAVALDHCAFPDLAGAPGEAALLALAGADAVRLKVTTHVLAAWDAEGRLEPTVQRLAEEFGAGRMCWGSDHPQHQGLTYGEKLALAERAVGGLTDDDRDRFFAGTALELGWSAGRATDDG
jgi:predicted TIM-barrel fold metal-dependent hydrolase